MTKDSFYYKTIKKLIDDKVLNQSMTALVVGGGPFDESVMKEIGFKSYTISNIDVNDNQEDAQIDGTNLPYPDASFDVVFAHATLHHMDKPHSCVCEMYRVAKAGLLFVESQDSFLMRLAHKLGMVVVYEKNAIRDSNFTRGGVNDDPIPNYVYRWTKREVEKLMMTYNPKVNHEFKFFRGWDFSSNRIRRRISERAPLLNNRVFYFFVDAFLAIFNLIFGFQGNLFGAFVHKKSETLKPWIKKENGKFIFVDK